MRTRIKNILDSNKINKEDILSVYTKDGERNVDGLFQGEKLLGNTPWTIIYKSHDLDEIREELRETQAELREVKTTLGHHDRLIMDELVDPIIRNTATNIILFFLGVQPKDNIDPQSFRFKDNTKNLKKLEDFIDVYELVDNARRWGKAMDKIITTRNIRIHPSTYDMLEQDVAKCKTYIANFPQLNANYKEEIGVIQHFQKFSGKEAPPIQTQE